MDFINASLFYRARERCAAIIAVVALLPACSNDEAGKSPENISELTDGRPLSVALIDCLAQFHIGLAVYEEGDNETVQKFEAVIADGQPYALLAIAKENPHLDLSEIYPMLDSRMRAAIDDKIQKFIGDSEDTSQQVSQCMKIYEQLSKIDRQLGLPNKIVELRAKSK